MPVDLWTHIGYARLAALLGARSGLVFAPNRQPGAEAAMRRAMEASGLSDPSRYAALVARDAEALAALLAEVTVGETYFFRESGQLHYIRDTVLPSLQTRPARGRPLRVWSAGCATGEEPYSLSMLLRDAGWQREARVLGTDISRARIEAAGRGRYTKWSMRGVAEDLVERYFIRRGPHFLVRPEIRALTEFRTHNLAATDWPGTASGVHEMDIVLCRNVLIYFDRETVAQVARRLLASLADDGWLFLGASDPMITELTDCETVVTGAGLAYRRAGHPWTVAHVPAQVHAARGIERQPEETSVMLAAGDAHQVPPAAPFDLLRGLVPAGGASRHDPAPAHEPAPTHDAATTGSDAPALDDSGARAYALRDYAAAAVAASDAIEREPADRDAWVMLVRALANMGRSEEAERACAEALQRVPETAELDYLHAILLTQRGQFAAAAAAARRALYLDRSLVMAQIALGSALAREGHRVQARRAFRAAERLLADMTPDAEVPLADGESASRLLAAARLQRERLAEVIA